MAKATLEIKIVDEGSSASAGMRAPAGAGQTVTAPASVRAPGRPATTVTDTAATASKAVGVAETIAEKAAIAQQVAGASGALGAGAASAAGSIGSVASVAAAAGPVGVAIAALGAAASVGVIGVTEFAKAMNSEAQKLGSVSGAIANATARSSLRQDFAELRRGQAIGPQLAEFEESRSRLMTKIYDLFTKIEGPFLTVVTPVMELLGQVLEAISPLIEVFGQVLKAQGEVNRRIIDFIKWWRGEKEKEEDLIDPAVKSIIEIVDRGDGTFEQPKQPFNRGI